jgi:hypothetical protein
MVERFVAERFLKKSVTIELINKPEFFYRGYVSEVTDSTLILEMHNGQPIAIALTEIRFIRGVDG